MGSRPTINPGGTLTPASQKNATALGRVSASLPRSSRPTSWIFGKTPVEQFRDAPINTWAHISLGTVDNRKVLILARLRGTHDNGNLITREVDVTAIACASKNPAVSDLVTVQPFVCSLPGLVPLVDVECEVEGYRPALAPGWFTADNGSWLEVRWHHPERPNKVALWLGRLGGYGKDVNPLVREIDHEFVADISEGARVYGYLYGRDVDSDFPEPNAQVVYASVFPAPMKDCRILGWSLVNKPPVRSGNTKRVEISRPLPTSDDAVHASSSRVAPPPTGQDMAAHNHVLWIHDCGPPARPGAADRETVRTHHRVPAAQEAAFHARIHAVLKGYTDGNAGTKERVLHELLDFPKRFLQKLSCGSKRQDSRFLKEQLAGSLVRQLPSATSQPSSHDFDVRMAKAATFQAREGNVGRGARKLDQKCVSFSLSDQHVRQKLIDMHPAEEPLAQEFESFFHARRLSRNVIDVEKLRDAARCLPKGASPGPTGWTAELVCQAIKDPAIALLLADVISDVASNRIAQSVTSRLTASRLIALPKEPTKPRPIAVGEVLLKVASIAVQAQHEKQLKKIFTGLQFGTCEKSGAEKIIHNLRLWYDDAVSERREMTICTLDCSNAFNSVSRRAIVQELMEQPELHTMVPIFELEYGRHSQLYYKDGDLSSQSGVRQGSVLGPCWFAFAIQRSLRRIADQHKDVKVLAYLDDVTLAGPAARVAVVASEIEAVFAPLGLQINRNKSEWLSTAGAPSPPKFVTPPAIKILGSFIGPDNACRELLLKRLAEHETFFRRLPMLDSDIALAILKKCGVPRVAYLARTNKPEIVAPLLQGFDRSVLAAFCEICDMAAPSAESTAFLELSQSAGGIGLTCWAKRCSISYAASYEASLFPPHGPISNVSEHNRCLEMEHRALAVIKDRPAMAAHLAATKGCTDVTRDVTTALFFPREAVQCYFRWLAGAVHPQIPARIACPGCKHELSRGDFYGHVAGCATCHGYNASSRHAAMKKVLHDILTALGIDFDEHEPREFNSYTCKGCNTKLVGKAIDTHPRECAKSRDTKGGVLAARGSGPDGRIYIPGDDRAKPPRKPRVVVWDVTIVSMTAPSHLGKSLEDAFGERTSAKNSRYQAQVEQSRDRPGQEFVVIGGSAFGQLSASTVRLFKELVASSNSGVTVAATLKKFSAALSFCSGHVIAEAERRVGVVHPVSPLQTTNHSTGRKGTAGAAVDDSDFLLLAR